MTRVRVLIIGGGVLGVSLAYHLTKEGWSEIALVEKGELTSGSTWHAAGLVTHCVESLNVARIVKYGSELYQRLEAETGQATYWHASGSIRLATNPDESDWLYRVKGVLDYAGCEAHILSPQEIRELNPLLEVDDVLVGLHTPADGHVDPSSATLAMARGARDGGATFYRNQRVTGITLRPDREWEVVTEKGTFVAEHVVNAAGSFGRQVGAMVGLEVPIVNMVHQYVVTEPMLEVEELDTEPPVVRDPVASCYFRKEQDGLLIGPYETGARAWGLDGIDWSFDRALLPPDLDRLLPWLELAGKRMPVFERAGIRRVVSGPITHTPDAGFLMGPAAGLRNFWMCVGASSGIAQGPGIGKYLAQWMVHGHTDINVRKMDPRRFADYAAGPYGLDRAIDEYEQRYQVRFPGEFREAGRPVKTSPIYERLKEQGAIFAEVYGWERPKWYSPEAEEERYSFRRTNWFDPVAAECRAVQERVGVVDLTSFSKFDVTGPGAAAFLDRICANRIARREGGIVLAHMLTETGRIEGEATITRLADEHFYVLSSIRGHQHDLDWITQHVLAGEEVAIGDLTDEFATLLVTGPRSRDVIAALTDADLSNEAFPWYRGREIEVAGVPTRALRLSYVGELGWELHHPMAHLDRLYSAVLETGAQHGIRDVGMYALESMRLEKGYKAWGVELTTEVTMLEADMERFIKFDKDFIGREATSAQRNGGLTTRCVYIEVEDGDPDPIGNEAVFADGEVIGVTSSGAYGHRVGRTLAFAFVDPGYAAPGTSFDITILGERRAARVLAEPAYDPANLRMRA